MTSDITPLGSGSVPARRLTADERAVVLKHLYDRARAEVKVDLTNLVAKRRIEQEGQTRRAVKREVTDAMEELDQISDPRVLEFMTEYTGQSLMDMAADVRGLQRTGVEKLEDILAEDYPVGIERPPTILEMLFGRTDTE